MNPKAMLDELVDPVVGMLKGTPPAANVKPLGLDFEKDVLKHPEYLQEAHETGSQLVMSIKS